MKVCVLLAADPAGPETAVLELTEWDTHALEEAIQLAEAGIADEVVAVTVGPAAADRPIRRALALGADRAIRIWDDEFAGTDVLTVGTKSTLLARSCAIEEPTLVLAGVQTRDLAWGGTGVAVAERLGYEWAAVVSDLTHEFDEGVARVRRELEAGVEELTTVDLPAVLTLSAGCNDPRPLTPAVDEDAGDAKIAISSLPDLGLESAALDPGIEETDRTTPEGDVTVLEGDPTESAAQLADILRDVVVEQ